MTNPREETNRLWVDDTKMTNPREETNRLLEMIDEGLIDPRNVVLMCVQHMSEADVADMMDCNELSERFMEEEDE